jgi:zinc protease
MVRYGIRYLIVTMVYVIWGSAVSSAQNPVPFPEVSAKRLLNSLQIVAAPTPYLDESMAIGLVIRYGSAFDGADKGGAANLLARMFMKATMDKTSKDIQEELAYLGATLDVWCDWDGIRFLMKGNSATFERSLLLLYQVVCDVKFTEEDLSAVKQELLQEIQQFPDPRSRIHTQFEIVLFGGNTYGRPLKGTPETINTMTVGDLKHFYDRYFSPNAASLLIVGDADPAQVLQKASRIWGLWIRKDPVPFTFAPAREPDDDIYLIEDDPGSPAVQFILGNFSPQRQDPLYGNIMLATRILQERIKKQLPTSLLTVGLDGRRMPGSLYVQGQAAAGDAVDQILKIQEVLEKMKQAPVSAEELAEAQNRIIEEFNNALKTTDGLCRMQLDIELYRLGSNYVSIFTERIRRCDADAVRQAAGNYFLPGKKIVILRGPVQSLMPELKRLGSFKQIAP